ncbi:MAG: DNA-binding transcriptional repressor PuuR [Candidatus Izimaplasma bacterium HR2]|nr:MAG: DNA-binding transcriptional repressor PuuR [Candidatus Izimaplasma bacterium HR2]
MFDNNGINKMNISVLGILIRVARMKQGYSLRNLATLTNISHTLISNIEKGKQPPSEATLADIFSVLKLKLYTEPEIKTEMTYFYKEIFSRIVNHHYIEASKLISEMEKKGHIYENSFEVVNYIVIRCLYYTITNIKLDVKEKTISQYEKVIEFFTLEQKQLFFFIKGLNYLNKEYFILASDNFEIALSLTDKEINPVVKEYLVQAYIGQYRITDSVALANAAIEEFEEKTVYVRAMKCRMLIAKIYVFILKLDKAQILVDYVDSFTKQFNIAVLTNECHILKSAIAFYNKDYILAVEELEEYTDQEARELILPRFRIYLMNKDDRLLDFYYDVMENKKDLLTINKYLLIKVLMMWVNKDVRVDKEYVDSLNQLSELSINSNDQEYIGLSHNLLIDYYRENRKYKKALEIADELLLLKKIHLNYYSIKNT